MIKDKFIYFEKFQLNPSMELTKLLILNIFQKIMKKENRYESIIDKKYII